MPTQRIAQHSYIFLAIAKDQRALHIFMRHHLTQCRALVFWEFGHGYHGVGNAFGDGSRRRNGDFLRIDQKCVSQSSDFGAQRRGKQKRLANTRQHFDNARDIRDKSHVEHAIGLVDNQYLDAAEHQLATVSHIDQAARRGDDHIRMLRQRSLLVRHGFAADQNGMAELMKFIVGGKIF